METKRFFELNSFSTNGYEAEKNFRETCSWYKSKFSKFNHFSGQTYQKYIKDYHKIKSLYLISKDKHNRTQIIIYNTEKEREEIKILKTPIALSSIICITLLPNGELFCFDYFHHLTKALIIDKNYEVRLLPSGLPLSNSSAIYFKSHIYCFGGGSILDKPTSFSRKFDLNENRWVNVTPMPKADFYCHSVIFNENILICGINENILLYSVDIDSFSTIPYRFLYASRKVLINADRLYLIECLGFIYESENEYAWNKILDSIIETNPDQLYCLYNKGEIYISIDSNKERYFKFDLKRRIMTKFL